MRCAQIFEMVMLKELGPTKPLSALAPEQKERVQQLVAKNRTHLHDDDTTLSAKLQEKTRDPRVPGFVRVLLWIVTPPSPRAPIGEVRMPHVPSVTHYVSSGMQRCNSMPAHT